MSVQSASPVTAPRPPARLTSHTNTLQGRLGDGTIHRHTVRQAMTAGQSDISQLVPNSGWAGEFQHAADLRAAVTTNTDDYTEFEEALLAEINIVRRDPKGYAALLEREAVLGYPFVLGGDEYFESDEAAEKVSSYQPPAAAVVPPITLPAPTGANRRGTDAETARTGASSHAGADDRVSTRPNSTTTVVTARSVRADGEEQADTNTSNEFMRTTLKAQGMTKLTLDQLRTHFRRHQAHRNALEGTVKQIIANWQQSQQAQRDAWAAEDEKAAKKNRRTASRKKSTASSLDEVLRERRHTMDRLSRAFAEQLRNVDEELQMERYACRRAMDGANLILECIRALRDAEPVPPLRSSRGLMLAARDAAHAFHVPPERVAVARTMVASLVNPEEVGIREETLPLIMPADDEDPMTSLMQQLEQRTTLNHADPSAGRTDVDLLCLIPLTPAKLRDELHDLSDASHRACHTYGYVSGEVRGIQTYATGTPRELVMGLLLGVAVPSYAFTDNASVGLLKSRPRGRASCLMDMRARLKIVPGFDGTMFSDIPEGTSQSEAVSAPIAGMMVCGAFHPTTAQAADRLNAEEESQTTSAGKRAAAAAHRLGPLLWRGAHLLGCAWQRVEAQRPIPTYDEDPREERWDEASGSEPAIIVSTNIVVASGFEEVNLIHQRENFSLGPVRRMVLEQRGVNTTTPGRDRLTATLVQSMKSDLPAVVDLHSSLGVELVYPTSHPLLVPRSQGVLALAVRADHNCVQLQTCVGAVSDPVPTSPLVNPYQVHMQRSCTDRDIVLILIDVVACFGGGNSILLHLFERDVTQKAESGFTHIGFVRLMRPEQRDDGSESSDIAQPVRGPPVRTVATLRDSSVAPSILPEPHDELLAEVDLVGGRSGGVGASGGLMLPVSRGWPSVSMSFHERGGAILSPMTAAVAAGSEPVRIAVYYPQGIPYMENHMTTIEALLQRLEEEEQADLMELSSLPPTPSPYSASGGETTGSVNFVGVGGGNKRRASRARGRKASMGSTSKVRRGSSAEHLSVLRTAEITLRQVEETHTNVDYTPQVLETMSLVALISIADELFQKVGCAKEGLSTAQKNAREEFDRIINENTKKKGREQTRIQQQEEEFALMVERAKSKVGAVEAILRTTRDLITRRERARLMRTTRMTQLREELATLQARVSSDGPLSVKLWLVDSNSLLSATTRVDPPPPAHPGSASNIMAFTGCAPSVCLRDDNTNVVTLQPSVHGQGTIYEASCTIPPTYGGRAVLLVDGVESISWNVLRE